MRRPWLASSSRLALPGGGVGVGPRRMGTAWRAQHAAGPQWPWAAEQAMPAGTISRQFAAPMSWPLPHPPKKGQVSALPGPRYEGTSRIARSMRDRRAWSARPAALAFCDDTALPAEAPACCPPAAADPPSRTTPAPLTVPPAWSLTCAEPASPAAAAACLLPARRIPSQARHTMASSRAALAPVDRGCLRLPCRRCTAKPGGTPDTACMRPVEDRLRMPAISMAPAAAHGAAEMSSRRRLRQQQLLSQPPQGARQHPFLKQHWLAGPDDTLCSCQRGVCARRSVVAATKRNRSGCSTVHVLHT